MRIILFVFTGIIKANGLVKDYHPTNFVLTISCPLFRKQTPKPGASIAIDGVCLTASHFFSNDDQAIGFDLGVETRSISLLANKTPHDVVNIEYALCAGDPIDGHMVQGHVDGIATLTCVKPVESGLMLGLRAPVDLLPLIVAKGSIAINGVSLTINRVDGDNFYVCLVPYTVEHTGFKNCREGDRFHIESDILGRYMLRFHQLYWRGPHGYDHR